MLEVQRSVNLQKILGGREGEIMKCSPCGDVSPRARVSHVAELETTPTKTNSAECGAGFIFAGCQGVWQAKGVKQ